MKTLIAVAVLASSLSVHAEGFAPWRAATVPTGASFERSTLDIETLGFHPQRDPVDEAAYVEGIAADLGPQGFQPWAS